jgi:D-threonate/D-erythronate kinase
MQIPGESIGIIADDLTGACDTGLQFHMETANTRILLDYTAVTQTASTNTWLVNTDSRHLEQYDAIAAVRKSVHFLRQQISLDRFYKKIDSTLRGHIAQECLAILDELRWKAAIVAPAYPDEGRRTVGGYQIVRGLPVGQTEIARDPLFPVRESHLPTLLGKTSDPSIVGYIPLSKVMDGAGPILMAIQEQISQNKKLIVVDACSDIDLEQLSLAINKMPSDINVLPCGSAGLAKALSKKWLLHREQHASPHMVIEKTPFLMVIGTASQTTHEQVQQLLSNFADLNPDGEIRLFNFTPAEILGLEPVEAKVEQILSVLGNPRNTVIISTSYLEDSLAKTMILAEEQNLTPNQASAKASQLLANVTRDILAQVPVKLMLSGGETANIVCKTIGTRSLQIIDQIEQSIPLMIDEQARWIITKSGGFGNPMSLVNIYRNLKSLESQEEVQHV